MADEVFRGVYVGHSDGILTLSVQALQWKSNSTELVKKVSKDDIVSAMWAQLGKNGALKILSKGSKVLTLSNFKAGDFDRIKLHFETSFQQKVEEDPIESNGGNWGEMKFEYNNMNFRSDEKSVLEIPL